MTNNNWHVPLSKFRDEQRKVIERLYGTQVNVCKYFGLTLRGFHFYAYEPDSEQITPDEALKILGLDRLLDIPSDVGIKRYKETIARLEQENIELNCQGEVAAHELCEAEQKIKDLEQQLASKQGLQNVDWDKLADGSATGLAQFSDGQVLPIKQMQNGKNARWVHSVRLIQEWIEHNYNPVKILATRPKPKPKYTTEQLEAVKAFADWISKRHDQHGDFEYWLMEQE